MNRCLVIGTLEMVSFLILTVNFRACAKGYIMLTVSTDVLIAGIGFTLTQRIAEAQTWQEQLSYVVGAALGSVAGMHLTKRRNT